jgi:hypothetical protein
MSAAATAAGYLYASGRLRGRNGRDNEPHDNDHHRDNDRHYGRGAEPAAKVGKPAVKVAVYHPEMRAPQSAAPQAAAPVARKTPKIEYRTRRWRPE